ncbi:flagellar motor protein MotD [Litoribrevibacter albus]|uniref:Flagellar motor protein MotD n=1 Tax=Litoribrevibacter albus TaxID=1473156 RepID=A0AA37SD49_9GAMM|nr:flagellar motor protein MotD [Litoribrevibacter albus]GLQ32361.1 flagellar motor protein MotD [Litoribrevibacter albus]
MARRRRINLHGPSHERWLISYADFITLMFAFFVVLYGISSVNEGKYKILASNLIGVFNAPPTSSNPIQIGDQARQIPITEKRLIVQPNQVAEQETSTTVPQEADMPKLQEAFEQGFEGLLKQGVMSLEGSEDWLEVTLGSEVLFGTGSSEPTRKAEDVIADVAMILGGYSNPIQVEGHTDNVPINNREYKSNWDLSAARAASVVRQLQEEGLDPSRLAAVGYGQFQPLVRNTTPLNRRKNRRIVLLISRSAVTRKDLDQVRQAQP